MHFCPYKYTYWYVRESQITLLGNTLFLLSSSSDFFSWAAQSYENVPTPLQQGPLGLHCILTGNFAVWRSLWGKGTLSLAPGQAPTMSEVLLSSAKCLSCSVLGSGLGKEMEYGVHCFYQSRPLPGLIRSSRTPQCASCGAYLLKVLQSAQNSCQCHPACTAKSHFTTAELCSAVINACAYPLNPRSDLAMKIINFVNC